MFNLKKTEKKAISDVIATVLLISLSVAAIGVLSAWIIPLVKESANLSPTISCIDLKSSPPIKIKDACFNEETKEIEVTLQRIAKDITLSSLSFRIDSNSESFSFRCGDGSKCSSCRVLESGKVRTYFFSFSDFVSDVEFSWAIDDCQMNSIEISGKCKK